MRGADYTILTHTETLPQNCLGQKCRYFVKNCARLQKVTGTFSI